LKTHTSASYSAISSGSLEQSLPAAAFRSCRMRGRWSIKPQGTKTCSSSNILAKPRNSSFSERLVSITDRLHKSNTVLSSALSQNLLPLFSRPASRNSPVDSSSIPAMLLHRKSQASIRFTSQTSSV
uniref:Uncharacterized protein n=1 Tax=Nothobranchius furzeri TaxID=105023 RepID=A0A8C6M615_NOTFU